MYALLFEGAGVSPSFAPVSSVATSDFWVLPASGVSKLMPSIVFGRFARLLMMLPRVSRTSGALPDNGMLVSTDAVNPSL